MLAYIKKTFVIQTASDFRKILKKLKEVVEVVYFQFLRSFRINTRVI